MKASRSQEHVPQLAFPSLGCAPASHPRVSVPPPPDLAVHSSGQAKSPRPGLRARPAPHDRGSPSPPQLPGRRPAPRPNKVSYAWVGAGRRGGCRGVRPELNWLEGRPEGVGGRGRGRGRRRHPGRRGSGQVAAATAGKRRVGAGTAGAQGQRGEALPLPRICPPVVAGRGGNLSIWPEGGVERVREKEEERKAGGGREGEKGRVHEHYKVTNMAPQSLASSLRSSQDALSTRAAPNSAGLGPHGSQTKPDSWRPKLIVCVCLCACVSVCVCVRA